MRISPIFYILPLLASINDSHATGLRPSEQRDWKKFGQSVSVSGTSALVGAIGHQHQGAVDSGGAFFYKDPSTHVGNVTEDTTLVASDSKVSGLLGQSVSLSGNIGLVGASYQTGVSTANSGAAYVYRALDTKTGVIVEQAKLVSSDGKANDYFGTSVSISGEIGIVGAPQHDSGAAYVYRNLGSAAGTVEQDLKLTATGGAYLGSSVSISGSMAIVGSTYTSDAGFASGAAYLFRDLDTKTGSTAQNAKLRASDGAASDMFGTSVAISGNLAVVGSPYAHDVVSTSGSVYLFRDLDTATDTIFESAKLRASDAGYSDLFGASVSISGDTVLVGAQRDDDKGSDSGSVYLFLNQQASTGTVTQNVKIIASDGVASASFGVSVSLDGDSFVVGTTQAEKGTYKGKAYSGSVSAMTTLDEGDTSRIISLLSFTSQEDWVVGETTDSNHVILSAGDTANVRAAGKAVYIGKEQGSDNNTLTINGVLRTALIQVGSTDGNEGNAVILNNSALSFDTLRLTGGNSFSIGGADYSDIDLLLAFLDDTILEVWNGGDWIEITSENSAHLVYTDFEGGNTNIYAIPEPATTALLLALPLLWLGGQIRSLRKQRNGVVLKTH